MSYDAAGNLTHDSYTGKGNRTYDAENRQTSAVSDIYGNQSFYTYDAAGKRVRRGTPTEQVWQIYGLDGELLAEYAANAAPTQPQKEYGYRSGELLVTAESGGQVNWLVADHLGTPRMVADLSGSLQGIRRHDYLPFGEEVGAGIGGRTTGQGYSQSDGIRQGFTGYEKDGETGLNFAQSRYYSPTMGRFISPDRPFADQYEEDPQSWNLYSYVRNNPLVYVDPNGLWRRVHHKDGEYWEAEKGDTLSGLADILGVSAQSLVDFYGSSHVGLGQIFDVGNYRSHQEANDLSVISLQQQLADIPRRRLMLIKQPEAMEMGLPAGAILRYIGRAVAKRAAKGSTTVYRSINPANGTTQYVGITNNFTRRALQHLRSKGIDIERIPGLQNISRSDARAVEQALIEINGLGRNGGTLVHNQINSIAQSNPAFASQLQRGLDILKSIGYPGL